MSLARTLMNGGSIGSTINPSKYTHDMGATRIAMETVEELHEIFIESFYNVEQAELAAATEGVELIGSEYEVVAEGAVRDVFTKVKEFLKKLWDKVKAWFHQVKRFLDSLFISGKEFAKRYKKDIQEADKTLTDFSFKMYDYADDKLDSVSKDFSIEDMTTEITNGMMSVAQKGTKDILLNPDKWEEFENNAKKMIDEDNLAKEFAKKTMQGSNVTVQGKEDLEEATFAYFRNGATSKEDKEDKDITDLGHYQGILESSKALSQISSMANSIDKAYRNAIKEVDTLSKVSYDSVKGLKDDEHYDMDVTTVSSDKNTPDKTTTVQIGKKQGMAYSKAASHISTGIARVQTMHNTFLNAWKSALKERDTVYKQLLIAGMSNARKNAKKK